MPESEDPELEELQQREDIAPTAVAVRLDEAVKTHELPSRMGAMRTIRLGTTSETVVGMDLGRKVCKVTNVGAEPAYLGERSLVDQGSAYTLPAGASVSIEHCEEVWGRCKTAAPATTELSILAENWAYA